MIFNVGTERGVNMSKKYAMQQKNYVPEMPRKKPQGYDINDINKIIEETVNMAVIKLKMAGLLKDNRKTAYQKTEELLRDYNTFCQVENQPSTEKMVKIINDALNDISDDEYYEIIDLFYFKGHTREYIADYFDTTVRTISRNKNRLVNKLKVRIFSDDTIFELFM